MWALPRFRYVIGPGRGPFARVADGFGQGQHKPLFLFIKWKGLAMGPKAGGERRHAVPVRHRFLAKPV